MRRNNKIIRNVITETKYDYVKFEILDKTKNRQHYITLFLNELNKAMNSINLIILNLGEKKNFEEDNKVLLNENYDGMSWDELIELNIIQIIKFNEQNVEELKSRKFKIKETTWKK